MSSEGQFKPKMLGIICNWCCYGGADLSSAAARSGLAVHDLAGLSRAVAWLAEQPGSGVSPDVTMEALEDVMSFF